MYKNTFTQIYQSQSFNPQPSLTKDYKNNALKMNNSNLLKSTLIATKLQKNVEQLNSNSQGAQMQSNKYSIRGKFHQTFLKDQF